MRRSLVILAIAALATTSTLLAANASVGNWKYNPRNRSSTRASLQEPDSESGSSW